MVLVTMLEIRKMSAVDLRNARHGPGFRMNPFVVVSISSNPQNEQTTQPDKVGECNPVWDFPMEFPLDNLAANLVFSLHCKLLGPGRVGNIGKVTLPVKTLFTVDPGDEEPPFRKVSRSVLSSGVPHGTLSFWYRVFGREIDVPLLPEPPVVPDPPVQQGTTVATTVVTTVVGTSAAVQAASAIIGLVG